MSERAVPACVEGHSIPRRVRGIKGQGAEQGSDNTAGNAISLNPESLETKLALH